MSQDQKVNPDDKKYASRLERVRKMLRLSKSSNPHEAANALAMAVRMMQEMKISFEDLGVMEIKTILVKTTLSRAFNRLPQFESDFVDLICRAFGVDMIYSYEDGKKCYKFYGLSDRVEIAAFSFEVLARQLNYARKKFIESQRAEYDWRWRFMERSLKNAIAENFCSGWVQGITEMVTEFNELTPQEQQSMKIYKEKNFKNLGSISTREWDYEDNDGYNRGFSSGQEAYLNRPVSGSSERQAALAYWN
ncbi:MAG: DUF2786 domain-containing protein [Succinivibrionaceae bacterium]|nr:DUF2786 domain-containing protein [Succinivibrionaceae bacterium]